MLTLVFLPAIQQWELMGWDEMASESASKNQNLSQRVNFSDILIRGM